MSLTIKVAEYDDIRGHVEYSIEVRDITGESWCFKRRYSALRFFHELLKKYEKRVPNFPPKKIFGNLNPEFLESRRKQIEQYFNSLTHIPEIIHSTAFKDFIKPFDKCPIIKNKKNQKRIFNKEINEAVQSAISKILDESSNDFIDISPFEKLAEEIKEKIKLEYDSGLSEVSIVSQSFTPKTIPENKQKLTKGISDSKWADVLFQDCFHLISSFK